ncbi:MAG: hypothetical protein ATN31_05040 [Candidatus Epulonipiscioides saccharophilum]|nr:MAG: hypothetical protein ATN31_05040 [Epulopiscium sp. AS2M-Bin001]
MIHLLFALIFLNYILFFEIIKDILIDCDKKSILKYLLAVVNTWGSYILLNSAERLPIWISYLLLSICTMIEVMWLFDGHKINKIICALMLPIHFIIINTMTLSIFAIINVQSIFEIISSIDTYLFIEEISIIIATIVNVIYCIMIKLFLKYHLKILSSSSSRLKPVFVLVIVIFSWLFVNSLRFEINNFDFVFYLAHIVLSICSLGIIYSCYWILYEYNELDNMNLFQSTEMEKKEMYKKILLGRSDTVIEVDLYLDKVNFYENNNPVYPYNWNLPYSKLVKESLSVNVYYLDRQKFIERTSIEYMIQIHENGIDMYEIEYRNEIFPGNYCWIRAILHVKNKITGNKFITVISMTDITDEKERESILLSKVERDEFTGLYNKTTTIQLITHYLRSNIVGALIIVDLDNFKNVNDKISHSVGDEAIKEASRKLEQLFSSEYDIVGRFGGDEFIVFIKNEIEVIELEHKCKAIGNLIDTTYKKDDIKVRVTASIGVGIIKNEIISYEALFDRADQAVYLSKEKGKNTFTIR